MNCPVLDDTTRIRSTATDLLKQLRRLKRDLALCEQCPAVDGCVVLREFQGQVDAALEEVWQAWN